MALDNFFNYLGGIRPVVGDEFSPITENELLNLEHEIGSRFPASYRGFLKTYGASAFVGASPDRALILFSPLRPLPYPISADGRRLFSAFYGASVDGDDNWSLNSQIRRYSGRMPEDLIPIGEDFGGDRICLAINGDSVGKVFYWDHRNEPLDDEEYAELHAKPRPPEALWDNIYLIASSFKDFLHRLSVADE